MIISAPQVQKKMPLIVYDMDYDSRIERAKVTYQVNVPGGCTYHDVAISYGDSIEMLIKETYDKLQEVQEMSPGGWNAARRFRELKNALRGKAKEKYICLVQRDYPNAADKTDANYEEVKRQIITKISDHAWPGDEIHTYLSSKASTSAARCEMEVIVSRNPTRFWPE